MGVPPVNEPGYVTQVIYWMPLAFTYTNFAELPTTEFSIANHGRIVRLAAILMAGRAGCAARSPRMSIKSERLLTDIAVAEGLSANGRTGVVMYSHLTTLRFPIALPTAFLLLGLAGCCVSGGGRTMRAGWDFRRIGKIAYFIEVVDTGWDEWIIAGQGHGMHNFPHSHPLTDGSAAVSESGPTPTRSKPQTRQPVLMNHVPASKAEHGRTRRNEAERNQTSYGGPFPEHQLARKPATPYKLPPGAFIFANH